MEEIVIDYNEEDIELSTFSSDNEDKILKLKITFKIIIILKILFIRKQYIILIIYINLW